MNSFRSSYAGSTTIPIFKAQDNLKYAQDLYRYQILYDRVIYDMTNYLKLFSSGSFDELKQVYSENKLRSLALSNRSSVYYNQTVKDLKNYKYNPNLFKSYQTNMYLILNGFSLAIKQSERLENATNEITMCRELLSSKEKLIEYIRTELSDTMMMETFRISQTYNAQAVLKPWYMKYLEMYGAPYDGVFNTEKMATVVELLIQQKVITLEEFIQNQTN